MRRPPVSEEIANKIWSVLIEHCGVRRPEPGSTEARYDSYSFVHDAMEGSWVEYRFGGAIGFGGKVWHNAASTVYWKFLFAALCNMELTT